MTPPPSVPPPAPPPAGISVCIVCRDEADRLGPCLASVAWADDVVVMDLESADGSADLARAHGARVVPHAPVPLVEWVRNAVAGHALHDWVLVLDPDERVADGLPPLLRAAAAEARYDAVVIPRMNYDFGYPPGSPLQRYEPQLRMYRRSRVAWPEVPNALPEVPEDRLYRVPPADAHVLVHDRSRTVPEVLDRVVRYAPLQAQSMLDRGEVFTARRMVGALAEGAYRHFVAGRAWRDGVPGLVRAGVLVAFKFYVWAAFWQLSGGARTPEDDRYVRRLGRWLEGPGAALGAAGRLRARLRGGRRARP